MFLRIGLFILFYFILGGVCSDVERSGRVYYGRFLRVNLGFCGAFPSDIRFQTIAIYQTCP